MSVKIIGAVSGVEADTDASRNLLTVEGLPAHPAAGGWYTVAGSPAAIVAAALGADTSLVSIRFNPASGRKAYIAKFRFIMTPATLGAAAGVGGALGLQRITTATPTGGSARTPCRLNEPLGTASDMTDCRDNNAALTMTSVVYGTEVAHTRLPLFVASAGWFEWNFEPMLDTGYPVVLQPGDGLVLRTRVALAATQTWVFSYTFHWLEK